MNTLKHFHSIRKELPPTTKPFKNRAKYTRKMKNGKVKELMQ